MKRHSYRVFGVPGLAAGVAALAGQPAVVASGSLPAKGLVSYTTSPVPGPPPLDDSLVEEAAIAAAELVEQWPEHFLGSTVSSSGGVLLAVADDEGRRIAEATLQLHPMVDLVETEQSWTAANDLSEQLRDATPFLREHVHTWGASAQYLGVLLQVDQPVPDSELASIEVFAEKHVVRVGVEVMPMSSEPTDSRDHDESPYAGGAHYQRKHEDGTWDGNLKGCSSGYGYKIGSGGYMLTAGHCFPSNGTHNWMWVPPSPVERAGKVSSTTWKGGDGNGTFQTGLDDANHGDLAVIAVGANGRTPGHQIWWGGVNTTNKIPVTGRDVPAAGINICFSGMKSGSDCGTTISLTNVNVTYNDGEVLRNGDRGYATNEHDCPDFGDSGGSVVRNHSGTEVQATAIGIVSGRGFNGLGDCFIFFTGIEEANQAWGGDLKYQP